MLEIIYYKTRFYTFNYLMKNICEIKNYIFDIKDNFFNKITNKNN